MKFEKSFLVLKKIKIKNFVDVKRQSRSVKNVEKYQFRVDSVA